MSAQLEKIISDAMSYAESHSAVKVAGILPRIKLGELARPKTIHIWLSPHTKSENFSAQTQYFSFSPSSYVQEIISKFPQSEVKLLFVDSFFEKESSRDPREYHDESVKYFSELDKAPEMIFAYDPLLMDLSKKETESGLPPFFDFLAKVSDGKLPSLKNTKIIGLEVSTVVFATLHVVPNLPKSIQNNLNIAFDSSTLVTPVSAANWIQEVMMARAVDELKGLLAKEGENPGLTKIIGGLADILKLLIREASSKPDLEKEAGLLKFLIKNSDKILNGEFKELEEKHNIKVSAERTENGIMISYKPNGTYERLILKTDLSDKFLLDLPSTQQFLRNSKQFARAEEVARDNKFNTIFVVEINDPNLEPKPINVPIDSFMTDLLIYDESKDELLKASSIVKSQSKALEPAK